ncbi:MAG: MBL fold metallo-hydrolase [Promethearchaeota archaeon]|nr:MAG: MBL fold metallo-hydrolase [Candidatus Lokiarchaeota archaeon]
MTKITLYDGKDTIGGNKIYLEEGGKGIFLDFGLNFKKHNNYFQEFLKPRSNRGVYDLITLDLLPKLNIYRKELIPADLSLSGYPSLDIEAVLLSHAHMDHYGSIGYLREDIPIIASPLTIAFLRGFLDISKSSLSKEVAYFSKKTFTDESKLVIKSARKDVSRNFVCIEDPSENLCDFFTRSLKSRTPFIENEIYELNDLDCQFDITAFNVDHSIYGATAYLIEGEQIIAYTGDFRMHGKKGNMSKQFIQNAKDSSVLIIEGTRAGREDTSESEENVYENCLQVAESTSGLLIADFSGRNFERLELFHKIARKTNRQIIIGSKEAYLLNGLEKADGINRLTNKLVFDEFRSRKRKWEDDYLIKERDIEYVNPDTVSQHLGDYLICFSFYDIKNLLDINPQGGSYIYSSSEAFEEESEFDFIRLNNWLNHFEINTYGFEILAEAGRLKPVFQKGFHASGHAAKSDLRWAIETIDPDYIIPVHTENPEWFVKNFENVKVGNKSYTV